MKKAIMICLLVGVNDVLLLAGINYLTKKILDNCLWTDYHKIMTTSTYHKRNG